MAVSGVGIFFIVLVLVVILGGASYIVYINFRARRLGLPPPKLNPFSRRSRQQSSTPNYIPPAPAPGGIQGWLTDKWNAFRNPRTAGGAYENTGYGGARGSNRDRRGFGALDPDEAWDARVQDETSGYYEEQELGLQDPSHGPYGGGGYGDASVRGEERGRTRSQQRELDNRYDEAMHGPAARSSNPFGDTAEPSNLSLRTVSPRPHEDANRAGGAKSHQKSKSSLGTESAGGSPTERRSVFREDM